MLRGAFYFASSFLPLALILLFTEFKVPMAPEYHYGVLAALSLFSIAGVIGTAHLWWRRSREQDSSTPLTLVKVSQKDADIFSYVLSYLIPFAALLSEDDAKALWMLGSFFIFLALLYARSDYFAVNPMMVLLNLRLYEAETRLGEQIRFMGEKELARNTVLRAVALSSGGRDYIEVRPAVRNSALQMTWAKGLPSMPHSLTSEAKESAPAPEGDPPSNAEQEATSEPS